MLTILIFVIGAISTYLLNLAIHMPSTTLFELTLTFVISVVFTILINALVAIVVCKLLPNKYFKDGYKFFAPSKLEIIFYQKLQIRRWKDKTLELGILNGFQKKRIKEFSENYIDKFILESNKGYLTHLTSILIPIPFLFILPSKYWLSCALPIAIINFIINFLSLAILRYNIPKLKSAKKFSLRKNQTEI